MLNHKKNRLLKALILSFVLVGSWLAPMMTQTAFADKQVCTMSYETTVEMYKSYLASEGAAINAPPPAVLEPDIIAQLSLKFGPGLGGANLANANLTYTFSHSDGAELFVAMNLYCSIWANNPEYIDWSKTECTITDEGGALSDAYLCNLDQVNLIWSVESS